MSTRTIPLWLAVLTNVNIVTGGAFFLMAPEVARRAGALAPLAWIAFGTILLPLVLVLAALARQYPTAGGLYVYSDKLVGRFTGLLSGWGYYVGTAAGNAVILHGFTTASGLSNHAPAFLIDTILVLLFAFFNLFNVQVLRLVQIVLTALKSMPMLLAVGALPLLFSWSHLTTGTITLNAYAPVIPLVLFSYVGIEACCAIGHSIVNGERNAARALLISLFVIIALYAGLQFGLIAIHGSINHPARPFEAIVPLLFGHGTSSYLMHALISGAILCSLLGGYYGMFYANNWNLFAIADEGALPGKDILTRCNRYHAPWVAVALQSALIIGLLAVVRNQVHLITMSDFGVVIAYFCSIAAFMRLASTSSRQRILVGGSAFASCSFLAYYCTLNLVNEGVHHIVPFIFLVGCGLLAHWYTRSQRGINLR